MLPAQIPVLTHPLVTLRPFENRDADLVLEAGTDVLIPLITTVPTTGEHDDALASITRQNDRLRRGLGYSFAIADSATDGAVGQIGLWTSEIRSGRTTIGYWIAERHRRQGYAAAALRTLTDWALTHDGMHRVQLHIEPHNTASRGVALACGFEREGLLRAWQDIGGERRDLEVYSVVRY